MLRVPTKDAHRRSAERPRPARSDPISGLGDVRELLAARRLPARTLLQLQRSVGNGTVTALILQRTPATTAARAGRALAKRLARSFGTRGAQLLYRSAARRALARLEKFGIDKSVAEHVAEHFVMVPGKAAHSLFESAFRSTAAVKALITETLKKGSAPILSVTDSGGLAWVFEAELGRTIGRAGKDALTKLRVVVDLNGRLITAFPANTFLKTITVSGLRGVRVTFSAALALITIQGVYENEAAAAIEAREAWDEANEPDWWEYLLPWGPSSTFGYEPDLGEVRQRAAAAADEIEAALGRPLDADERADVEADIKGIWLEQPSEAVGGE